MERGLVADRGHAQALHEPSWIEGRPERSFITGLKTKGKARHVVLTFRCTRCGYLESYAREE
jgi:hypothetical protein